jgi:hypothetical protein
MVEQFHLGFCNRSLNYHLPDKDRVEGFRQRGRLEELGIFREKTGHEHCVGSLVIPIINLNGEAVQMSGDSSFFKGREENCRGWIRYRVLCRYNGI